MSDELSFVDEILTAVNRHQIEVMEATDALIPAAAPSDGAQGADTPEMLFQPGGVVFEVPAVTALVINGGCLFAGRRPSEHLLDEK